MSRNTMDGYYWRLRRQVGRKYDPDQPRVPAGSPEGGRWTSGGGDVHERAERERLRRALRRDPSADINWSREEGASGLVPVQMGEAYHRTVRMSPLDFLGLATRMYDKPGTLEYLGDRMWAGEPVAPPWLAVTWDEGRSLWVVTQHEGRHRATAAHDDAFNDVIPVDLVFNEGMRSRDVTDEMMRAPFERQGRPGDVVDVEREVVR